LNKKSIEKCYIEGKLAFGFDTAIEL